MYKNFKKKILMKKNNKILFIRIMKTSNFEEYDDVILGDYELSFCNNHKNMTLYFKHGNCDDYFDITLNELVDALKIIS